MPLPEDSTAREYNSPHATSMEDSNMNESSDPVPLTAPPAEDRDSDAEEWTVPVPVPGVPSQDNQSIPERSSAPERLPRRQLQLQPLIFLSLKMCHGVELYGDTGCVTQFARQISTGLRGSSVMDNN